MVKKRFYCGKEVTDSQITRGTATETIHGLHAHYDCIDSHRKGATMNDQAQHTLGGADSACQSIGLATSLLRESLGNMGEILTQGCMELGPASLGSTMRLGQKLKEASFLLIDLWKDAHGLCVLLGKDLGIVGDEAWEVADSLAQGLSYGNGFQPMDMLDSEDLGPGEDEFDDDEQPF